MNFLNKYMEIGEKRWLARQVFMEKKRKLEEYRLTHEGELPPLSFCEKVWEKLTGHNKYEILDGDTNLNQVQVGRGSLIILLLAKDQFYHPPHFLFRYVFLPTDNEAAGSKKAEY